MSRHEVIRHLGVELGYAVPKVEELHETDLHYELNHAMGTRIVQSSGESPCVVVSIPSAPNAKTNRNGRYEAWRYGCFHTSGPFLWCPYSKGLTTIRVYIRASILKLHVWPWDLKLRFALTQPELPALEARTEHRVLVNERGPTKKKVLTP